jgi:hypothetical protein
MAVSLGLRRIHRDQNRLYDGLKNFLLATSCLIFASYIKIYGRQPPPGSDAEVHGQQVRHLKIKIPVYGFLDHALNRTSPDSFEISLETPATALRPDATPYNEHFKDTVLIFISPIFVEYYENYIQWIVNTYGGRSDNWHETWRFARVIRNAISHGGKISIDSQRDRSVMWYGASYAFADNGKVIFGTDISVGDMICLLLEMDEILDDLGCPLII